VVPLVCLSSVDVAYGIPSLSLTSTQYIQLGLSYFGFFICFSLDTSGSAKAVPGMPSGALQPGSGWRGFAKFSGLERYGVDLRGWAWIAAYSGVADELVQHAAMALPGCFVGWPILGGMCSIRWVRVISVKRGPQISPLRHAPVPRATPRAGEMTKFVVEQDSTFPGKVRGTADPSATLGNEQTKSVVPHLRRSTGYLWTQPFRAGLMLGVGPPGLDCKHRFPHVHSSLKLAAGKSTAPTARRGQAGMTQGRGDASGKRGC